MRIGKKTRNMMDWLAENPDKTVNEIADGLGMDRGSVRSRLYTLLRYGKVARRTQLSGKIWNRTYEFVWWVIEDGKK